MNENMTNEMNDQVSTAIDEVQTSGSSILPILAVVGAAIGAGIFLYKKHKKNQKEKEIELNQSEEAPIEVEVVDGGKSTK